MRVPATEGAKGPFFYPGIRLQAFVSRPNGDGDLTHRIDKIGAILCLPLPAGLATTHGRSLAQMDRTDVRLTLPECLVRHPE